MVKLFTFVFFTASLFSVILAGTPFDKRTTQDVLYAISRVSHATTELDQLLTMFSSSGSTPGAVEIHNAAISLNTGLGFATTAVNNNKLVIHPDADIILEAVLSIEPIIDHVLNEAVAKKSAFQALPIGGILAFVHQDLVTLKSSTQTFTDALIANAPSDIVANGTANRTRLLAAFDVTIAAYT